MLSTNAQISVTNVFRFVSTLIDGSILEDATPSMGLAMVIAAKPIAAIKTGIGRRRILVRGKHAWVQRRHILAWRRTTSAKACLGSTTARLGLAKASLDSAKAQLGSAKAHLGLAKAHCSSATAHPGSAKDLASAKGHTRIRRRHVWIRRRCIWLGRRRVGVRRRHFWDKTHLDSANAHLASVILNKTNSNKRVTHCMAQALLGQWLITWVGPGLLHIGRQYTATSLS